MFRIALIATAMLSIAACSKKEPTELQVGSHSQEAGSSTAAYTLRTLEGGDKKKPYILSISSDSSAVLKTPEGVEIPARLSSGSHSGNGGFMLELDSQGARRTLGFNVNGDRLLCADCILAGYPDGWTTRNRD